MNLEYLAQLARSIKADNEAHPERTEIMATLRDQFAWSPETEPALMKIAETLLAAGYSKPRTITTREELDALPSGSVILDSAGEPNVFHDNGWVLPGGSGGYTSWSVAQSLPAKVLYEPEVTL